MFFGIAGLTTFLALIPATISPRTLFTTAQTAPTDLSDTQAQRFKVRLTLSSIEIDVESVGAEVRAIAFSASIAFAHLIQPAILSG